MKRIAIVTATRAEYGLLMPLIRRVIEDDELDLDLIVTGGHLSEKQGMTIDEIIADGFPISHQIPILDEDNSPYGISVTMANAIRGFAKCFKEDRPDMLVILGDRTEMLGVASAAMNERIPIAHIHGGEVTEGAVDDCVRHALTKMSYLHFTATELYRSRVIQLGECPERVFNVGSLGTENILSQELYGIEELVEELPELLQRESRPFALVTFHPVTLDGSNAIAETGELCEAMEKLNEVFFIITGANTDAGGNEINKLLRAYADSHDNGFFVYNLGLKRYLSVMRFASFVLGNSSSGILEAPVMGTPSVNVGDRQKGRIMAETVVCTETKAKSITEGIKKCMDMPHKKSLIFGNGCTSLEILSAIKRAFDNGVELKKGFYDLPIIGAEGM